MAADLFWKMNTESSVEDKVMGEKHAPKITITGDLKPGAKVKIRADVGGGKHPNENAHHIQWIELRCNDLYVGRADFAPVIMDPVVDFTMVVPGSATTLTISAVSRCNLHGLWESKVQKTVG